MEVINVKLVEVALNPEDNFKKYLCIENSNSYEFISIPNLGQMSFWKADYKNLLDRGDIRVREIPNQPEITYTI